MKALPAVTFIVPTYGRAGTLPATLECALRQKSVEFEIVVATQDPQPSETLQNLALLHGERLRMLHLPEPNANAARNAAVREARGEILLSIDDDVLFDDDFAARHTAHYGDKKVGFVMSLTREQSGEQLSSTLEASARRFQLRAPLQPGDCVPIDWAATCAASFRRSAVEKAGWFDPYFTGGVADDTDMTVRIRTVGYTGLLDTAILVTHLAAKDGGFESRAPRRSRERRIVDQRMRMYFAWKNRRQIGMSEVWKFYFSALRASVRANRDAHGLFGCITATGTFARAAFLATRDAQRSGFVP